jgi:hypothetical protein
MTQGSSYNQAAALALASAEDSLAETPPTATVIGTHA